VQGLLKAQCSEAQWLRRGASEPDQPIGLQRMRGRLPLDAARLRQQQEIAHENLSLKDDLALQHVDIANQERGA
jgi:hypothetical protein